MSDKKEIKSKLAPFQKTQKISETDLGRKMPQALELEKAVLCAIMLDKEAIDTVREILEAESFYLPSHQAIYTSALKISSTNTPIDIGILAEQMMKDGVLEMAGGPAYLIELSNTVGSAANVEFHARIIAQKYIQRELIALGNSVIEKAYDPTKDVFVLLDETESQIYNLADNYTSKDPSPINKILLDSISSIKHRMSTRDDKKLTGIHTGFKQLNELTGGWQKSDLIIVAGRPGMGKTAFTLAVARNASVLDNKKVVFFTLEMSTKQIIDRLISMEAEIDQKKIQRGDLQPHEFEKITSKIGALNKASLFIDDTAGLSIMDFRKKVRKLKREVGLDLIIIDYLQLMSGNMQDGTSKTITNREQEIAFISRSLKSIAKELEVPIIALAQLSRQTEQRANTSAKGKRPLLSDLRESGSIEQDADMVIFLYREEYYNKDNPQDAEGNSLKGIAEIIVEKHRNGEPGTVKARFIGKYIKFVDLDSFGDFDSNMENFGTPTLDGDPFSSDDFGQRPKSKILPSKMNDDKPLPPPPGYLEDFDSSFIDGDAPI